MLINKSTKVEDGDIITIKLTSGEEMISKLVSESDTHYNLNRPHVLAMTPKGVEMLPYLFSASELTEVPLNKSTVTVAVPTAKEVADRYIQLTTNIQLV